MPFTRAIKKRALERQGFRCACCGTPLYGLCEADRARHYFGEGVHAHHVRHRKAQGLDTLGNCVVICWSCHYGVHEGGNYRYGTVQGRRQDYPHFKETPDGI